MESNQYFLTYLDWRRVDVLISTPTQLDVLLKAQNASAKTVLAPKFIVLDEFDQMLTDRKFFNSVSNVLKEMGSGVRSGQKLTEHVVERKVDLS